jgi:hypothetical protein
MTTQAIIDAIERVIDDPKMRAGEKGLVLQNLAEEYWKAVFPEIDTSAYERLSAEDQMRRWQEVEERDEVANSRYPQLIRSVINWPATGEIFTWLEK